MGDFVIDFRPRNERIHFAKAAAFLKFQDHVIVETREFPEFSLALSSVDQPALWGPSYSDDVFAAVCGRIDLEERQWASAEKLAGTGGLAARYVAQQYRENGAAGLERFSGNFALVVWDRKKNLLFIVTDLCGALPIFKSVAQGKTAFASHADALAICIDESQNLDDVSLREFILTSCVTPPYTYYRNIRSLSEGSIVTVDLAAKPCVEKIRKYFSIEFRGSELSSESALAEELAQAFVASVRKRTLPRLGPVAVALSGGLDSRTILAAAPDRSNIFAFCCFNEENFEFATAREIADALNVKLVPLPRSFDYYGDAAALGIKIAGGMGTFANNHFLGVSNHLRELGAQNLLTGCYCDYLFKALPLNTEHWPVVRKERLGEYRHDFYFPHYRMNQPTAEPVRARLEERFPSEIRNARSAEAVFKLEKLRTFPLFQEGDNAQRLVPQRVMSSYLPVADRAVLETYCKIPYRQKFDRSLFKKAVQLICSPRVCAITDANTGAPANASLLREAASVAATRVKRKFQKRRAAIATQTSWPDWSYYVPHSEKLKAMWQESFPEADEIFRQTLPAEDIRPTPAAYSGDDLFLAVRMLSLKLWLQQRC